MTVEKEFLASSDVSKGVNREIKDSLFTKLFSDVKYLRQLYDGLYKDGDKYRDADFKLITLENVLVNDVYNDLGFMVGDRLIVLVEAQSTFNPNMALRLLIYAAHTYQDYIKEKGPVYTEDINYRYRSRILYWYIQEQRSLMNIKA